MFNTLAASGGVALPSQNHHRHGISRFSRNSAIQRSQSCRLPPTTSSSLLGSERGGEQEAAGPLHQTNCSRSMLVGGGGGNNEARTPPPPGATPRSAAGYGLLPSQGGEVDHTEQDNLVDFVHHSSPVGPAVSVYPRGFNKRTAAAADGTSISISASASHNHQNSSRGAEDDNDHSTGSSNNSSSSSNSTNSEDFSRRPASNLSPPPHQPVQQEPVDPPPLFVRPRTASPPRPRGWQGRGELSPFPHHSHAPSSHNYAEARSGGWRMQQEAPSSSSFPPPPWYYESPPPAAHQRAPRQTPPPAAAATTTTTTSSPRSIMVEIFPGVHAKLRGADETRECVRTNYFVRCICPSCDMDMFCIQDATYVLCPECRVVSPLDIMLVVAKDGRESTMLEISSNHSRDAFFDDSGHHHRSSNHDNNNNNNNNNNNTGTNNDGGGLGLGFTMAELQAIQHEYYLMSQPRQQHHHGGQRGFSHYHRW